MFNPLNPSRGTNFSLARLANRTLVPSQPEWMGSPDVILMNFTAVVNNTFLILDNVVLAFLPMPFEKDPHGKCRPRT